VGNHSGVAITADIAYMAFGPLAAGTQLSLQSILGFSPLAGRIRYGTPAKDCLVVGRLLGEKLVLTEFVAYSDLAAHLGAAARGRS